MCLPLPSGEMQRFSNVHRLPTDAPSRQPYHSPVLPPQSNGKEVEEIIIRIKSQLVGYCQNHRIVVLSYHNRKAEKHIPLFPKRGIYADTVEAAVLQPLHVRRTLYISDTTSPLLNQSTQSHPKPLITRTQHQTR